MTDPSDIDAFESARPRLTGRAYRMLGTLADADDVVQDAWLRWAAAEAGSIDNPDAWLNTVVTRLALDRLRRRKRDEARYVGPWLPSPLVEQAIDPAEVAELSDSMTTAFLIMLESLSPDERAAFLLADVFGERFDAIAVTMDRTPESCRQLASRARRKLRDTGQSRRDEARAAASVAERFMVALAAGDERAAIACLAPDATYVSDGGPDQRAARYPVHVPARIVRLLRNLWRRHDETWLVEPARIGGFPGVVVRRRGGAVFSTVSCEVLDGRIVRITSVLNPHKLAGIEREPSTLT